LNRVFESQGGEERQGYAAGSTRCFMTRYRIALAALLISTLPAMAMEPAKTMTTPGGKVFTNSKGMTLYVFDKDTAKKSNCYDGCARAWPPFMAASGAKPEGEWTIVERTDGHKMWAYDGKPLYTYAKDKKPGDMTGDGVGGVWHLALDQ